MVGTIPHKHECGCEAYEFREWLPHIAPDFLWFDIQDVGYYQGSVYGVALYKDKIMIYEDSYGSCSGCGAWGEGGEPESQDSVIELSKSFDTPEEAIKYMNKPSNEGGMSRYDRPDIAAMTEAINEADRYRKGESG